MSICGKQIFIYVSLYSLRIYKFINMILYVNIILKTYLKINFFMEKIFIISFYTLFHKNSTFSTMQFSPVFKKLWIIQ